MNTFTAFIIGVLISLMFTAFIGGGVWLIFKVAQVETLSTNSVVFGICTYFFMSILTDFCKKVL